MFGLKIYFVSQIILVPTNFESHKNFGGKNEGPKILDGQQISNSKMFLGKINFELKQNLGERNLIRRIGVQIIFGPK